MSDMPNELSDLMSVRIMRKTPPTTAAVIAKLVRPMTPRSETIEYYSLSF